MDRIKATIFGRVQGVGFRYFVVQQANLLGLSGWVRNRMNGTVETVAEGEREKLDQFLLALRTGPSASRVENVDYHFEKASNEFSGFRSRMTR